MRMLVSGSTGFLGTALIESLEGQGHAVVRLVRPGTAQKNARGDRAQGVTWDPVADRFDADAADGADALIHLAGASIAEGRWNASRKALLRTSRIDATRHLIGALAKLQRPPRVIVAASAIGYYGNRGDESLTEASAPGNDFLARLCREWEMETARGSEFGARVVNPRFGIILAAHGGALPRMALPFKFGAGGRLGDGRQWMSWLTLQEAVSIIQFALGSSVLTGPRQCRRPQPCSPTANSTAVLAKALHRPALFPAPALALQLALGEMADALLLSSQRVIPSKLSDSGYSFLQTNLASALAEVFRR